MAHFAKLNSDNIVEQVVVVSNDIAITEQAGIDFLNKLYNNNNIWKQTSYNTKAGKYYNSDETLGDQSKAFRKNYAGIGFQYDQQRDAFIPPKPYNSWIFNEQTCSWEPPIPYPTDGKMYSWDEENKNWILL